MKTPKFISYLPRFAYQSLPDYYFFQKRKSLDLFLKQYNASYINSRLDYYCSSLATFKESDKSIEIGDIKRGKGIHYYFDLMEFARMFPSDKKLNFAFGDDLTVYPVATLIKARPLMQENANSILFKLNKHRHFVFEKDTLQYREKADKAIWRGAAYAEGRRLLIQKFWGNKRIDVGQTNRHVENVPWQVEKISRQAQMQAKFILCPEGNDVATNLKWVLWSNSLCIMPKPTCESWFMEGKLEAGVHYAEVAADYSNLEDVIEYYLSNPSQAESIISNAHEHVAQFLTPKLEDALCMKVMERFIFNS